MTMMRPERIVITGGGTAGHVLPALAVAEALVERGHERSDVSFVGSKRGMEGTLVTNAGFPIVLLGGRGIVRRVSVQNVAAVFGLFGAFAQALKHIVKVRPGAVVSVGGYASVPCSFAAALLRTPVVVVNVDAVPGLANRLVGRIAKVCAVAFEDTPLPHRVVTGAPVRPAIEMVTRTQDERERARNALGIPEGLRLVVIAGGSLGARRLNEAGIDMARSFADRPDVFIYHVVGARNFDEVSNEIAERPVGSNYRYVAFSDDMPAVLSAADLMVCRSGAMTVAELAITGTPSILVPLPGAPNDHQRKNAAALADRGAAFVMNDADVSAESLADLIVPLIANPSHLDAMGVAAFQLGKRHAAQAIAGLVDNVVSTRRTNVS